MRFAGVQAYILLGGLLSSMRAESHGGRFVDDILVVVNRRANNEEYEKERRDLVNADMRALC